MVGIHFTAYLMYIFISFLWFYHHSSAFLWLYLSILNPKVIIKLHNLKNGEKLWVLSKITWIWIRFGLLYLYFWAKTLLTKCIGIEFQSSKVEIILEWQQVENFSYGVVNTWIFISTSNSVTVHFICFFLHNDQTFRQYVLTAFYLFTKFASLLLILKFKPQFDHL